MTKATRATPDPLTSDSDPAAPSHTPPPAPLSGRPQQRRRRSVALPLCCICFGHLSLLLHHALHAGSLHLHTLGLLPAQQGQGIEGPSKWRGKNISRDYRLGCQSCAQPLASCSCCIRGGHDHIITHVPTHLLRQLGSCLRLDLRLMQPCLHAARHQLGLQCSQGSRLCTCLLPCQAEQSQQSRCSCTAQHIFTPCAWLLRG